MKIKNLAENICQKCDQEIINGISNLISDLILVATGNERLQIPAVKRVCNLDVYVPSEGRYEKAPFEIRTLFVDDNGNLCIVYYDPCLANYTRDFLSDHTLDDNITILKLVRDIIKEMKETDEEFECPFCGSEKIRYNHSERTIYCDECEREYETYDIRFETLRHTLSPHLCETTEKEPLPITIDLADGRKITGCFYDPDARIWFHLEKDGKPLEPEDIDFFSITTVRRVLKQIEG